MLVVLKQTCTGTLWAGRLSAIFSPLLEGLNGLLEKFCGRVDIGIGLNHGVQSIVSSASTASRVSGDTQHSASSTYSKNSVGPRMLPCGMHARI